MEMSPNLQLLIATSKFRSDPADISTIQTAVRHENFDFDHLFLLARRHRVAPRVWNNISRYASSTITDSQKKELKDLLHSHLLHCAAVMRQLCTVYHLFKHQKIPCIPYKGPVLAGYLYKDFTLRSYGDLDLLISPTDFRKVYNFLLENGYTPEIELQPNQFSSYISGEDDLPFLPVEKGVRIEIHWELTGRYLAKPLGIEYISRRISSTLIEGQNFPIFSPEDLFVYFCLHGTKHGWEQLDLVSCLSELIYRENKLSWQRVIQTANTFKCRRIVHLGILLVRKIYRSEVPLNVLDVAKKDKKASLLCGKIFTILNESAKAREPNGKAGVDVRFSLLRLQARDSLPDKIRYALRLFFYPSKAEWISVKLPSWLNCAYWIVRPFRIVSMVVGGTISRKWKI